MGFSTRADVSNNYYRVTLDAKIRSRGLKIGFQFRIRLRLSCPMHRWTRILTGVVAELVEAASVDTLASCER